ncbi:NAD(P)-binding protein [Punctularia strigosozonata HHB-11173 SS5]|uniref:NAD(P)-binding protein n=1 Tax=Punctularia strigosozonata (strain HHB-11173) TaxID=741275 RepID=UPI00044163C8|nr:NAD(P)-binding protein [Punctularia strigosozonata HHB-11173 SS5]EIN14648.1 NAD(P)-binding protein [Punctularia strigosozonata HHB-11173 SS5]
MSFASPIKAALGKAAFVTGAGQGIGRAIATRLARDGFDIAIGDIPPADPKVKDVIKEIEGYGRKAIGVHVASSNHIFFVLILRTFADVKQPDQIAAGIQETVSKLGPLFVSVANAGVTQVKPLLECTPEWIRNEVDINLHGLMNTHIAAARQMVKQGEGGRILGAGSIASYRTAENLGPYGATKFAVRGFTEVAAKEWAQYGIRVNAYGPGIVDTPMWDHIDAELARIEGLTVGEAKALRVKRDIKLGRIQEPEDVAKLVSFLVSDEGEYITGQTICSCGGASL